MSDITIYVSPSCPYCTRAKSLLKQKNVTGWKEINIATEDGAREEMLQRSGGRKTVPQIFIGNTHVGGFDDLNALDKAGKLDALLAA